MSKAILMLADGKVFEGISFGTPGECTGELVFNTSMTGYQEILTDPSYKGQIITMTYPHIGNYGINDEDNESRGIFAEALVVREYSKSVSNWRAKMNLADFLVKHCIIGIEGIDTRALTKHLRDFGAQQAIISTVDFDLTSLKSKLVRAPGLIGRDLVQEVVENRVYEWVENIAPVWSNQIPLSPPLIKGDTAGFKTPLLIIVIDCGVKFNILRCLKQRGCKVTVVPATTGYEEIISLSPDGILISNGPGDPEGVPYLIETVRRLIDYNIQAANKGGKLIPIFGICLGQQILGLALGGKTYKLKFGHHGANHPVKDLATGKIEITVQNHGFCVDIDSLPEQIEITHLNLNDQTAEGFQHREIPVFSVQYHPESSAGPQDSRYLFDRFIEKIIATNEHE